MTEPQQARKFSAYGVTQDDDPLSQAMRGLIDNASSQEHQIALLWQAIETLSANPQTKDCVPAMQRSRSTSRRTSSTNWWASSGWSWLRQEAADYKHSC